MRPSILSLRLTICFFRKMQQHFSVQFGSLAIEAEEWVGVGDDPGVCTPDGGVGVCNNPGVCIDPGVSSFDLFEFPVVGVHKVLRVAAAWFMTVVDEDGLTVTVEVSSSDVFMTRVDGDMIGELASMEARGVIILGVGVAGSSGKMGDTLGPESVLLGVSKTSGDDNDMMLILFSRRGFAVLLLFGVNTYVLIFAVFSIAAVTFGRIDLSTTTLPASMIDGRCFALHQSMDVFLPCISTVLFVLYIWI